MRIVRCMDRIYKICSATGKVTRRKKHGPGGDLQGKKQPQDLMMWPDMWEHMSDAPKKKEKQRWAIEKPKLDIARQSRGIFLLNQKMKKIIPAHNESRS